jgi:16S rRNA (cytosine1402-N4)-methyltransferase
MRRKYDYNFKYGKALKEEEGRHVRRKRYRGNHPRSFAEKYKEHDPGKYPDDMKQILSRGDTPAGSHRSILVPEIIRILAPRPGEIAIDATLGYGGHAREILKNILPGGRLYGFDRDPEELKRTTERFRIEIIPADASSDCFIPVQANFSTLSEYLATEGIPGVDSILADLGLSSMQIDNPERGFSFKQKGPLDMRMNPETGLSAREYLSGITEEKLGNILAANADEPMAAEIARAICRHRGKLNTTRDLAEAICSVFPELEFKNPAMAKTLRRCFQAIRIEVNAEFASLDAFLASLPSCLKPGGRVAILCFHSGEDRRVEESFKAGQASGQYSAIATEPIRPGHAERYDNPRSSSAKLRWAIRS